LFFLYLFLLRVIKASAPSSESNPNYQPPSIESRLDKRRGEEEDEGDDIADVVGCIDQLFLY
jgi:hypothetical protein